MHRLASGLAARLGVRPHEGGVVVLLFALFLAGGAARAATRAIAYTGFLSHYPSSAIPYVYIAVGLVICALMPAFLALAGRLTPQTLAVGTFTALAAGQVGLWALRTAGVGAAVDLALPVWYEAISMMLNLSMWAVAGAVLDVAQGKRLYSLVGAGFPLAFILCGSAIPPLVAVAGPTALLLAGAVALLAGAGLVLALRPPASTTAATPATTLRTTLRRPVTPEAERPPRGRRPALLADPYVRVLFGLGVCWTLVFYLADYVFYARSAARYPREADLAAFMGQYSAVMGVAMLVTGIGIAPRLLGRWGVTRAVHVMPGAMTAGALPIAVLGTLSGLTPGLFWPAYATKVGNYAADTVDRATRGMLYQPLPPATRARVQALSEGVATPVATAAAGVLLLVGTRLLGLGPVEASYLLLAVLAGWFGLARSAARQYPQRLVDAVARRRIGDGPLTLDRTARGLLRERLAAAEPETVLFALRALGDGDPAVRRALPGLLTHPDPAVRAAAAGQIPPGDPAAAAAAREAFAAETDPAALVALARTLARGDDADRDAVAERLHRDGPGLAPDVQVALAALLLAAGEPWRSRVGADGDPLTTSLAAAIGLGDADAWQQVVTAATAYGPGTRATRERALRALVAAADTPGVTTALVSDLVAAPVTRLAATVVARSGSARLAAELTGPLLQALAERPVEDRTAVLADLARARAVGHRHRLHAAVDRLVAQESEYAALLRAVPQPPAGLLARALRLERERAARRLVTLAGLRDGGGTVLATLRALPPGAPTPRQLGYLIEVLESAGERSLADVVRGLFAPQQPTGGTVDAAARLAREGSAWTRACLAEAGGAPGRDVTPGGRVMLSVVERVLVLQRVSLFTHVPDDVLAAVAALLTEVDATAGERLFATGDRATGMYVVVAGTVRVHDLDDHTIAVLGEREVFGEMALLDDEPRSATVTATTDTLLLRLDRDDLDELMADHPAIAAGIIRVLLERLRARTTDVLELQARRAD